MTDTTEASTEERASQLRAGALGAIDGLTSTAGVVIGVAATGSSQRTVAFLGLLALVSGAVSMASGEYASVASQRDAEAADGVSRAELPSAWVAAFTSAVSFAAGAVIPTLAATLAPSGWRVLAAVLAVLAGLAATGVLVGRVGDIPVGRSLRRTLVGGGAAMAITWAMGSS